MKRKNFYLSSFSRFRSFSLPLNSVLVSLCGSDSDALDRFEKKCGAVVVDAWTGLIPVGLATVGCVGAVLITKSWSSRLWFVCCRCEFVRFPLFLFCVSAGLFIVLDLNGISWLGGDQNQSVHELMMQISLVDEAETCEKDWNDIWFRIWTNSFGDRLIGYGHSKKKKIIIK